MKSRNREINIFSLSLMDVISGAMGAFLIVMVIQARYTAVVEGDPEKLRPRLDAAIEALAGIRAGTKKTILDRFEEGTTPTTLGLSAGELVPEIEALGQALRTDVSRINDGFADALEARGAATRALADASAGTEKTFAAHMSRSKPATLGLIRGKEVSEIEALGKALAKDIDDIEHGLDITRNRLSAAIGSQWIASASTEKVMKDRVGKKPATQGLPRGESVSEIDNLGQALKADIDTIYREFRKGKENEPSIPFTVTTIFPCEKGDVSLQVASNEIDPKSGKPFPPYTPVPDRSAFPRQGSWALLNTSLDGSGADYSLRQPAFTYMNSRAIAGREYKLFLIGFTGNCAGHVMMIGKGVRTLGQGRTMDARFHENQRVTLSWPRDSVTLSDGKRHGMYFLGTIKVSKDSELAFAAASDRIRDRELAAMQARIDGTDGPGGQDNGKSPLTKEAALATIDKLPVPRHAPECLRMVDSALHTLSRMRLSPDQIKLTPAEGQKALNEVRIDCTKDRFQDANKKLKAVIHRIIQ